MHAFRSKRGEQRMQVGDAVIDHEGSRAGSEVLRVGRKEAPGRRPDTLWIVRTIPVESSAAPFLDIDSQVGLVPGAQGLGVFGLEEDPTDTSDSLHDVSGAGRVAARFVLGLTDRA